MDESSPIRHRQGEHWLRDIDYQKYAETEAEMGWLNGLVTMKFPVPVDGEPISGRLAEKIAQGLGKAKRQNRAPEVAGGRTDRERQGRRHPRGGKTCPGGYLHGPIALPGSNY